MLISCISFAHPCLRILHAQTLKFPQLTRLVAIARGEQEYFDPNGIPTATEACKSNALMRCSKDLGIASELWDPRFIREFKDKYCVEVFAEHWSTKKKCVVFLLS